MASSGELLAVGAAAPDFQYQSHDYLWQRFHNMLEQGAVVIVFGPSDETLRSLERERDALIARGVLPVAVLDRRDNEVWKTLRRLDLTYSLLADPRGVIASDFGVWNAAARRPQPAWYVVSADGRIRAAGRGEPPAQGVASVAFDALGLPPEGSTRPASRRLESRGSNR